MKRDLIECAREVVAADRDSVGRKTLRLDLALGKMALALLEHDARAAPATPSAPLEERVRALAVGWQRDAMSIYTPPDGRLALARCASELGALLASPSTGARSEGADLTQVKAYVLAALRSLRGVGNDEEKVDRCYGILQGALDYVKRFTDPAPAPPPSGETGGLRGPGGLCVMCRRPIAEHLPTSEPRCIYRPEVRALPGVVPHHAADGTIRHYCTADACPDIGPGSMRASPETPEQREHDRRVAWLREHRPEEYAAAGRDWTDRGSVVALNRLMSEAPPSAPEQRDGGGPTTKERS
jgi:hypothetical protein